MQNISTIKISKKVKKDLEEFKEYKNESYNEIIRKLTYIAKLCEKEPSLAKKTANEIKKNKARVKSEVFYSDAELRKMSKR